MAFQQDNLETVVTSYWKPGIHHYNTTDALSTVQAPGYLNADKNRFKLYDHVSIVITTEGNDPKTYWFVVTAADPDVVITPSTLAPELTDGSPDMTTVMWAGNWTQAQYPKGAMVRDGAWTMVANKTTYDKPAPYPEGDPKYLYDGTGLLDTSEVTSQIIFGTRVTVSAADYLAGYRVYLTVGFQYEVYAVADPEGAQQFEFLFGTTAGSTGWLEVPLSPRILPPGGSFDLIVIAREPDPTNVTTPLSYNYTLPNNAGVPLSGSIIHANREPAILSVSKTDNDGGDASATLAGMGVGDTITIDGETSAWTIASVTDLPTSVNFGVNPPLQAPIAGVKTFNFNTTTPTAINYPVETDWWSGSAYAGQAQGLLAVGTAYADIVPDNTFYGVDLRVQPARISEDWDIAAWSE